MSEMRGRLQHHWSKGDIILGTEGMTRAGPILVGDEGPLKGTVYDGECPFCEEVVYSSYPTTTKES